MQLRDYQHRYLIVFDFDGTLFDTFSPSSKGIGVDRVYELSIGEILGKQAALEFTSTGLNNRTPSEVIRDTLLPNKTRESFLQHARTFFGNTDKKFQEANPWDKEDPEKTIIEMLVYRRLQYLLTAIGPDENGRIWPQPCGEVLSFLISLKRLKDQGVPIDIAVISSGHEAFIKKTFTTWDVPLPDILVTEDDIRSKPFPKEITRRFKPGQLPLALAHFKWLDMQNLISHALRSEGNLIVETGKETKQRMVYVGDSVEKDLQMAIRGNIDGIHVPAIPWEDLQMVFIANAGNFDGRPIADILFQDTKIAEGNGYIKNGEAVNGSPAYARSRR